MPGEYDPRPLFDAANDFVNTDLPTRLDIGKIEVPEGEIGFATIRQGNTTVSIPLDHALAAEWAGIFSELADMLAPSGKLVSAVRPGSLIVPSR